MTEAHSTFDCFGSSCSVFVIGDGECGKPEEAVGWARDRLVEWHRTFTRFDPGSELSRLNADPRHAVPVSSEMVLFAQLVSRAAAVTGGLVDATLVSEIEAAGYTADLREPAPLRDALAAVPARRAAGPSPDSRWRLLRVDPEEDLIIRPPGLRLDSGGLAKGLFCDLLAQRLCTHEAFAVDCAGDIRIGGTARIARLVQIGSPFDETVLHELEAREMAAATSGIGRRSWTDASGRPAHHLLDPATGRPAFTGIVQVTAFAGTATVAEMYAKAAILSGPARAREWLPHGGVVVYEDAGYDVIETAAAAA
jgi:thiamine biosynthesis lipoprotein